MNIPKSSHVNLIGNSPIYSLSLLFKSIEEDIYSSNNNVNIAKAPKTLLMNHISVDFSLY